MQFGVDSIYTCISDQKLSDHSIVFASWYQQLKNGQVTPGFATNFLVFFLKSLYKNDL